MSFHCTVNFWNCARQFGTFQQHNIISKLKAMLPHFKLSETNEIQLSYILSMQYRNKIVPADKECFSRYYMNATRIISFWQTLIAR